MTFIKGGILNSNQLENISGKKWKKGGILSATQLNKLSNGGEESALIKSIPVKVVNNSGNIINAYYVDLTDGKISYGQLYQTADVTERTINCCVFEYLVDGYGTVYNAIPFTGAYVDRNKVHVTAKSGCEVLAEVDPAKDGYSYIRSIRYYPVSIADDEMITITVDA